MLIIVSKAKKGDTVCVFMKDNELVIEMKKKKITSSSMNMGSKVKVK
jgi:hypothetical protein